MKFILLLTKRISVTSKMWFSSHIFSHLFVIYSFQVIFTQQNEQLLVKDMKFKLLSGDLMPMIGLGTSHLQDLKNTLDYALEAGYRMIDTAARYNNEEDIGKALKELLPKYNLTRQDIFITTKLASSDQGEGAYAALEKSIQNLDCQYVDLYLIHTPGVSGLNGSDPDHSKKRDISWQKLVQAVNNGLTKNIGVCNYNVRHMQELLVNDHGIKPAVNQIEWHPYYHQKELLDLCNKEGILLEAYSSLGGTGNKDLLENPEVKKIAEKLGKSPAQVLLRWAVQQNIAVIPKSKSKKHIEENIDLNFVIPEDDMNTLSSFNTTTKYSPDPDTIV